VATSVSLGRFIQMTALFGVSLFLLGCSPPSSTEKLDPDRFTFNAFVNYFPATGEGVIGIDLSFDVLLSNPTTLNLGKGDSIVIVSGDNRTVVNSIPEGSEWLPISVDVGSELSVDFQRYGASLKKFTVMVDGQVLPTVESDVSTLDSSSRAINASFGFGIPLPHEINEGFTFGYGTTAPIRCYQEDVGFTEIDDRSALHDLFGFFESYISSPLDETTLNPQLSANSLIAWQYRELLLSGVYDYCETQLFSFAALSGPYVLSQIERPYITEYASYSEQGDLPGALAVHLVSNPIVLQINRSSL